MKFQILLFSVLQDIAGGDALEVECGVNTLTVNELLAKVYSLHPGLEKWDSKIRVAADHEYVERDATISSSQEIAMMPPVQGG